MAIRIRKVDGHLVALCAAETKAKVGDLYLDDTVHHALSIKFYADLIVNDLVEKLKSFMAEKGLSITDVASLIKKDYKTVWQFLKRQVKPHDSTVYSIKKLMGDQSRRKK